MLELYGRGYVVDHVVALLQYEVKKEKYRSYVADALKLAGENLAKLTGGPYIAVRWSELNGKGQSTRDNRTGDEIAADVIRRVGLKLREESEQWQM